MRYFIFTNETGMVISTLMSARVPGLGPGLPPDCVEVNESTWNRASITFGARWENGELVNPPPRKPVLTLRQFFRLFTKAEALSIGAARNTDTDIEYFWTMLTMDQQVDLNSTDITAGLALLVSKGLLTSARATAIAANQSP